MAHNPTTPRGRKPSENGTDALGHVLQIARRVISAAKHDTRQRRIGTILNNALKGERFPGVSRTVSADRSAAPEPPMVGLLVAHTASLIIGLWSARRCTTSKPMRSNVEARPVYTTESDFAMSVSHG